MRYSPSFTVESVSALEQPKGQGFANCFVGQLQKMGVMAPAKAQVVTPSALKRRSGQLDFSSLGPLKTSGTVGFSAFRDNEAQPSRRRKSRKKSNGGMGAAMDEDSDDDDDDDDAILGKMEDIDTKYDKSKLGPEDAKFTGELADGVNRIRVCWLTLLLTIPS
jgi:hypothetical protein